jgi:hypothetical protein
VKNITQSIGFPEIKNRLSKIKKRRLPHFGLHKYQGKKVFFYLTSEETLYAIKLLTFVMQGLMLNMALKIQQEKEDFELLKL